ncbi:MAG: molecular chaperone TorD family protein [Acidimicrobiia bacterium]|nr:MAG: molecular chaperone TorD family protein [Acidimicrobiia bacterium]
MTTLTEPRVDEGRIRAGIYCLLGEALRHPTAAIDPGLLRDLEFEDPPLDMARLTLVAEAAASDLDDLRRGHTRTFPPIESQDSPTFETAYVGKDVFQQTNRMADVAAFYRAHGLKVGGKVKERPDAIGPQLEFMGFLAFKEAAAIESGMDDLAETCDDTQQKFLREHLGVWGSEFGRRLALTGDHPFYRALGAFIAAWLEEELDRRGVVPAAMGPAPEPVSHPAEEDCGPTPACGAGGCGCGGEAHG